MRCGKRGLTWVACLACLLAGGVGPLWAAESGIAPGMTPAGRFSLGLEGGWLFQERLADSQEYGREEGQPETSQTSREVTFKGDRFYGARLAYGLHRRLTLSALAGMVDGGVWGQTLVNGRWEARLKSGFAWGLGARGLLWESACGLGLVAGLDYLRWDDRGIKNWRYPDGGSTDQFGVAVDSSVDYWRVQAEVLAHWRLGGWTPYLGAAYAHAKFKNQETWTNPDGSQEFYRDEFTNQDHWGLVGGVRAELAPNFILTLRGAWLVREELGLALTYWF